jgi:hypothetical protein
LTFVPFPETSVGLPFAGRAIQNFQISRTALEDPAPFRHTGPVVGFGAQTKGKHGSNLSAEHSLLCQVFTRLMQA